VNQYKKSKCDQQRKEIFDFYLSHINQINNWDLVDSSAPYIVGEYLADSDDRRILIQLAHSPNLWQRRIAILSTLAFLKRKDPSSTIEISTILLTDTHDLIHKAVGWMLREMGKRVSEKKLTDFLDQHAAIMPRTMLRYSLEKLTEQQIKKYMTVTKNH
jgi:3-methyladenine DNA glycosylase AlkD